MRSFAALLVEEVTSGQPFICLIADDERLRTLNRDFLQHDYATDVLSFPNPEEEGSEAGLGEVAISLERAAAQASEFGHAVETELKILLLHGVLHLMGLDHERDKGQMKSVESKLREQFGLPGGLIERTQRGDAR